DRVVSHTGTERRVTQVSEQGVIPLVTISTSAGRVIKAAPDHPFLTPQGWVNAGDLSAGQSLGVLSEPDAVVSQRSNHCDAEFRLAGYFTGDGSCSANNCNVLSADEGVMVDLQRLADELGFAVRFVPYKRSNAVSAQFSNPAGPKRSGGPRHWLH